jgi:hypothetical protein
MADFTYKAGPTLALPRTDWRAIWAGTFIFYAIWAVFGALGLAIFASNSNPNAAAPVLGQSVGMAIWAIILTIIAMYVAGRETARLARLTTKFDGLVHGLIMFGLSVVGLLLLAAIGGVTITQGNLAPASTHNPTAITVVANIGWGSFVALLLGWLAAMWGASTGASHKLDRSRPADAREMRPAA